MKVSQSRPRAQPPSRGNAAASRRAAAPSPQPAPQLPHERDQSPDPVTGPARDANADPRIAQAASDLARGLVDTDMRATPGVDSERRERLVPGPAGKSGRKRPA